MSSSGLPGTMRAWTYRKTGKPEDVLKLESDRPLPALAGHPIIVKVKAAALNPVGYKVMSQMPSLVTKKPATPEQDFSGVVAGGDLSGTDLTIGDEVFGQYAAEQQIKHGAGSLAEYVCAMPANCVRKPENISFSEAAGVSLACLTAYTAMVDTCGMKAGHRVLVNGGTGGVGIWAVQIAKATGCYVVATCSGQNIERVKGYGADEGVDYKQDDMFADLAQRYGDDDKKFDVVFDSVGTPELYHRCEGFVKPTGHVATISLPSDTLTSAISAGLSFADAKLRPAFLGGSKIPYSFVMLKPETLGGALRQLASWLEEGKLKAVIDSEHKFEDALEAYKVMLSGRAKGKVIVTME